MLSRGPENEINERKMGMHTLMAPQRADVLALYCALAQPAAARQLNGPRYNLQVNALSV